MNGKDLLAGLSDAQKEAVTQKEGPILVVAGAGTGKTTVITRRIAWLVAQGLAKPEEILALTFTEKAATEMLTRVDEISDYIYSGLSISTFHSFGADLVSEYAFELGLPADLRVLSDVEQILFIRDHIFEFSFKHYQNLAEPTSLIRELVRIFSRAKDEAVSPKDWVLWAQDAVGAATTPAEREEAEKQLEIARAYETYMRLLRAEGYIDYGDQINLVLELLKKPSIAKKIKDRFKYALVDEFQDTNFAQNEVVRQIFGEGGNVMAVGDDDQCLPGNTLVRTPKGQTRIDQLKIGQEVLSGVGRGCIGVTKIDHVFKRKKRATHITFELESGDKITATDNHKMFCCPGEAPLSGGRYYVYLMESKELGFRLGVTNNLKKRLRLERMADRIFALRICSSIDEAMYYENLYSLKYQIPTSCFRDRNCIKSKTEWLEKIFAGIDTRTNAWKLAADLGVDLNWHHYAFQGVIRGAKRRNCVYLEICQRNYRPKNQTGKIMRNNKVAHSLAFESSDLATKKLLISNGFHLTTAKNGGYRFREISSDLGHLSGRAKKLVELSGGIFECNFKAGTSNIMTGKAVCLPASNILEGMAVPVFRNGMIRYSTVVKVTKKIREVAVYDLEVASSHNFIANNVVVHNSIYKFRGAAVSNILDFREEYKKVKTVVLTENYRSTQEILDVAYRLIQNNNPDRLEAKYKINKQLKACGKKKHGEVPRLMLFDTETQEAEAVAEEIQHLREQGVSYSEMAILFRGNRQAEEFVRTLVKHNIPHVFSGAAGLYEKQEVRMLTSLIRALHDPEDDLATFHLASSEVFGMDGDDLAQIARWAAKRNQALGKVLSDLGPISSQLGLSDKTVLIGAKITTELSRLREEAKTATAGEVINIFLRDSGFYADLTRQAEKGIPEAHVKISNIAAFFDKIIHFQRNYRDHSLESFSRYLTLVMEAGDDPKSFEPVEGLDAVSVITVHKAKGLEFDYVFVSSLSDSHLPGRGMAEKFSVPADLIKEKVGGESSDLAEERRLFYVALTRAKKGLYLTAALDYGTKKTHKISRFVAEALGEQPIEKRFLKPEPIERLKQFERVPNLYAVKLEPIPASEKMVFSRAAIDDFLTCPFKYQLIHVTPIRIVADANIAYGNAIHNSIGEYYKRRMAGKKVSISDVLEWFSVFWDEAGFLSKAHEQARYETGRAALRAFYARAEKEPLPKFSEKEFKFKVGGDIIRGRYDAIFSETDGKVRIVDFKTSNVKRQEEADDRTKKSTQLATYALSWQKETGQLPADVSLYFVDTGVEGHFVPTEKAAEKTEIEIRTAIAGIKARQYEATPSLFVCKYCPFKFYCPKAILEKTQS